MQVSRKRAKTISKIRDSEIDYSDIPELTSSFWKRAELVMPEKKKAISLRLDAEILRWFKARGKGYQSQINAVLKTYVESKKGSR